MIEPDTVIDGRYRVISRLGSGGMADVYLAQDQLLGREVAVKVLHHHFAEDQEFVERFRREASSAAALSHPNIVAIFDRGEWNGTYYIAMEYVAGRSLKAIVREDGPLDPATAIDIVIQILRAARFAHRRGVIHRDLKPHNVILDEEGRARVTDFGIARAGASDMTLTGSIMGTAQYLSPEQAQGFTVSAASDLYSVGVILYELLTGAVPFEGETAVAIAYKQVAAVPRAPSELNGALPPSLDAVVLRALAKSPGERYADADELIAALQQERERLPSFTGATVVRSAPEGQVHHAPAPVQRAPTGPMLLAPASTYDEANGQSGSDERGKRRRNALLWALAVLVVVAGAAAAALLLTRSGKTVDVPTVVGLSEQAAIAELHGAGLNPVASQAASAGVAKGLVIRQSPSAGTRATKGSSVDVLVSTGPASAKLANVAGQPVATALARLKRDGFKPTAKTEVSATVKSGVVIATEPAAGSEAQLGSAVTVLVSSGPAPVRVPDVTGVPLATAEATLTNAELVTGTITQKVTSTQTAGTVLSQSPAAGGSSRAGEKVNLTVAEAPKEVAVPNVVGTPEATAAAALQHAGFDPKTTSKATSEPSQVGVVLEQSPAGGTKAPKGSEVTLAVGVLQSSTTTTSTTATPPTTEPGSTPANP